MGLFLDCLVVVYCHCSPCCTGSSLHHRQIHKGGSSHLSVHVTSSTGGDDGEEACRQEYIISDIFIVFNFNIIGQSYKHLVSPV